MDKKYRSIFSTHDTKYVLFHAESYQMNIVPTVTKQIVKTIDLNSLITAIATFDTPLA